MSVLRGPGDELAFLENNPLQSLGYPAAGLHYFRDKLYAVAPTASVRIIPHDGFFLPYPDDNWTLAVTAGDVMYNTANSALAYVTSVTTGTFPYSGTVKYYELGVVMLNGTYEDLLEAFGTTPTFLSGATPAGLGGGATIHLGYIGSGENMLKARATSSTYGCLWQSRTEQQAIDAGNVPIFYGWIPVDQGFLINFSNGTVEFNKLERSATAIPTSATYYLTDGACVLSCEVVSYFLSSGTFAGGTAAGTLQIRNIQLVSGTLDVDIDNTWDIHSANPPGGGNKVADLASDITVNSLPLIPDLIESNTKYDFQTHNFYGDADWDAMYGVNGVDRGFYYTGSLFAKIFTQANAAADTPRHVAAHSNHLCLGFSAGSVLTSVVGEPHNFLGASGAAEHAVGDKVTGLMSLSGQAMGIFCEKSVHSLVGTGIADFAVQVIAPDTGCIEYTLANIGVPIYCNSSGIVSLEQSEKYGDFVGVPLSYDVNPWLRKRLRRVSGRYFKQPSVMGAMPCRSKNQYRLYFRDGKILTMTIQADGPKFTFQSFEIGGQPLIPFAWSSETDESGQEFMHFSYYDVKTGNYSAYVYQWDEGWGQAGQPISNNFEINWFFGERPDQFMGVQKCRLYGLTHGLASLKVQASGIQNQLIAQYHDREEILDLPGTSEMFTEDAVPRTSGMASLSNRGLAIQLKISNRQDSVMEPPHTCQVLVLGTKLQGASDL